MLAFIVTIIYAYIAYLALTAGSGHVLGYWSESELLMGLFLSIIVAAISHKYLCRSGNYRMLNPVRWILFIVYGFGPFFAAMAKANIDVAYRVITGKIRPGIVKIDPKLKTDYGITFLANSITLTPGTLSVDEKDGVLYVHWINVPEGEEKKEFATIKKVCGSFADWARRVAE
ncbi:MAG: cation:proton antiporter [Euryarchaeota archaeon]|nr:cation:proton antiporter [Euryarchaeota archaeon]